MVEMMSEVLLDLVIIAAVLLLAWIGVEMQVRRGKTYQKQAKETGEALVLVTNLAYPDRKELVTELFIRRVDARSVKQVIVADWVPAYYLKPGEHDLLVMARRFKRVWIGFNRRYRSNLRLRVTIEPNEIYTLVYDWDKDQLEFVVCEGRLRDKVAHAVSGRQSTDDQTGAG